MTHAGRRSVPSAARRALLAAGLVLAAAAPAAADLLRCQGPDGRTIFTDDASRCPGAKPFEPRATLQPAPGATPADADGAEAEPPASAGAGAARDLAADAERAEAQRWAQKKQAAEAEREQVVARRDYLRGFVAHCNRGGEVTTRDEAGIKHTVSCDALRADFAALEAREAELRDYLQGGLAEECRRAGCLPGWIR